MNLTEEEVDWAYQVVFGRPAENDDVRSFWTVNAVDLRHLVDSLVESNEAIANRHSVDGDVVHDLSPAIQARLVPILRRLRPHRAIGAEKIRIGRDHDGGYVMVDDLDGVQAAYSLGISDDVSWDFDLANRGIEVLQFDHTIARCPIEHPLLRWSKLGIEGLPSDDAQLDTLPNILTRNAHRDRTDLILKCDIEGHEWEMLSHLSSNLLDCFRQIVIELHVLNRIKEPAFLDAFRRAVHALTANHRVVHVHANNCAPYFILGGVPLPSVLELTLLRRDRRPLEPSDEVFPTRLDMPNAPHLADFVLGTFQF
ncbi:hypothetical protein U8607_09910 [Methylobacterium durans]|uniref:hypothetical protein n=1 Tax=Methylobacterium durans TaxID=2202825 RepID=UPI002AFDE1D5|nr:hypothetical protein [Methylobacterium durans]MEA1832400.1 hypothetical protein [Methylobacterium durans]